MSKCSSLSAWTDAKRASLTQLQPRLGRPSAWSAPHGSTAAEFGKARDQLDAAPLTNPQIADSQALRNRPLRRFTVADFRITA